EWVSPLTTTLFPIVQIGADEVRSILQVWRHASNKSISASWASGSDTNADSTWSVTTTDSLEVASGDQLVIFSASTDSVGGTQSLSASGATFSSVTETVALWVNNASVTAGSSNTNVSYTAQNFPAVGGTIILRIREVDPPDEINLSVIPGQGSLFALGAHAEASLGAASGEGTVNAVTGVLQANLGLVEETGTLFPTGRLFLLDHIAGSGELYDLTQTLHAPLGLVTETGLPNP